MNDDGQNVAVPWSAIEKLRCDIVLQVPVSQFGVGALLELAPGSVVDTKWPLTKEVPLAVNKRQVAWAEFEVLGRRLGVRITELK